MLSDGTDLFFMGNDGLRYSPASNSWSLLPNYQAVKRGEAAGTYDAISDLFLMIGGRNTTLSAINLIYESATDSFASEPGTLPIAMDAAVAHTMPGTNLTYVAGGKNNGGVGLVSHVAGATTWAQLANAPVDLGIPIGMGEFDGFMWVARPDGSFAFYDPGNNTWTGHQIAAPARLLGTATVNAETYVVTQVDSTSDVIIYRLNAIE